MKIDNEKKKKIFRICIVSSIFILLFVGIFLLLYYTGILKQLNSVENIRAIIQDTGIYGKVIFILLQFLQVTFIPIPSTVLTIAGAIAFGPLQGSLLSLAGILMGSAVAFLLGKTFGVKLISYMVGKDNCVKWRKYLSNAKYSFVIMMLLPMFPDDILCLVAGLTDMSWSFFMITNFIARPLGIFLTSYLGSGDIIPYTGWGIAIWVVILLIAFFMVYLTTKYKDLIEKKLVKLKFKKKVDKSNY